MINGKQISDARALLGWTESELAIKSRISVLGIQRIEKHGTGESIFIEALQKALEAGGIEFIKDGDQRSVRLKPTV